MYIRLVVTYCKEGKLVPKEAHVDLNVSNDDHAILQDCLFILNKKLPEIQKMIPVHLKNKDFDCFIRFPPYISSNIIQFLLVIYNSFL